MSKTLFKLQVPAEPESEFVSHGNLEAELKPGSIIETTNPNFARWLVDSHKLTIVSETEVDADVAAADDAEEVPDEQLPEEIDAEAYPADFPGRDALIEANVSFETVKTLTAEQLDDYKGIGPKTAADIVAYFEGGTE